MTAHDHPFPARAFRRPWRNLAPVAAALALVTGFCTLNATKARAIELSDWARAHATPEVLVLPELTPMTLHHLGAPSDLVAPFMEVQAKGAFKAALGMLTLLNIQARQAGIPLDPSAPLRSTPAECEVKFHFYLGQLRDLYQTALLRHLGPGRAETALIESGRMTVALFGADQGWMVVPLPRGLAQAALPEAKSASLSSDG